MKNDLNIIYTVDDSYIPQLGASITSVITNNKNRNICFYIATDLNQYTKNFLELKEYYSNNRIKIVHIDCKEYDKYFNEARLDKWGSGSYYVYWRINAFDKMKCDFAWYLDADILCLKEISNPRIGNCVVGCVIDSVHSFYNKILKLEKDFCFFNTGTMFVDVKKWKSNNISSRILDVIKKCDKKFIMADQDYISFGISELICPISPKYNYFVGYDFYGINNSFKMYELDKKKFYTETEICESKKDVVFYHCLNGVFGRPWEVGNTSPIKNKYLEYRNQSFSPCFQKERKNFILFRIEKIMSHFPKKIYNKIHSIAIKIYIFLKVITHNPN